MFASNLNKKKYKNVCLIEASKTLAPKVKVSGGAKCNITNEFISSKNYLGDEKFIKTILEKFSKDDLLAFLNKNKIFPKINPKIVKGTYFCNSSQEIIDMFSLLTTYVKKYLETVVLDVYFDEKLEHFKIKTTKGEILSKKLVVASGGLSFPILGASSIAFDIAKKFGHTIIKPEPALVGFTVQKDEFWFKNLSGVSLNTKVLVEDKNLEGSFLFTHKGCSGPVILTSSLYWKKGKIIIDFLPNKKIEKFLLDNKNKSKNISSALPLPKRFIQEFLLAQNLEDKPVSKLNKDELEKLNLLKNYEFSPAGNFGFSKAEVTKGGINTDEINRSSFESLKQKNLFFIGECLDITGELGGYNLQMVFSQAYICSKEFCL